MVCVLRFKLFVNLKSITLKDDAVENMRCNIKELTWINCIITWVLSVIIPFQA